MFRKFVFTISLVALLLSLGQNAFSGPSATIMLTVAIGGATPPLAPTGLTAQAGDAIVDLSWNANSEPDLNGYNIYRSGVQGGPYTKINSAIIINTNYQDTGLTNDATYYYVITAVDDETQESSYSTETQVTLDIWIYFTSGGSNAFSPNDDGAYDEFNFSYYLIKNGLVTIEMFDSTSTLVRTLKSSAAESIGTQSAAWDGKDSLGAVLADGEYLCVVRVEDGQGAQAQIQGTITIDNHFMRITEPPDATVFNLGENFTFRAMSSLYISNATNVHFECSVQGSGTWKSAGQAAQQADGSWIIHGDADESTPVDIVFEMRVVADYEDLNGQARTEQSDAIEFSFTNEFNVYNISDAPDAFSPNGDSNFDVVTMGYTINAEVLISVKLYDSSDTLIRTLKNNILESAGDSTVVWDGRNDGAVLMPEGIYTYKITGDAGQENQRLMEGTITIDNNFMSFTEPVPGTTVSGTMTVKAIVSANTQNESNVLFYAREKVVGGDWDAIGDDTPPVKQPDGSWIQTIETLQGALNTVYEFRIGADYADLNNQPRTDYTIPVEYTVENEIIITYVGDEPDAFSPNGDAQYDSAVIEYRINVPASVTVKIYNQNDMIVRTLKENVLEIAGDNTAVWDGMDNGAVLMPDGIYTYKIDAHDSGQNQAQQRVGTITLDNYFMNITEPLAGAELIRQVGFKAVPSSYISGENNVLFSYRLKGTSTWTNMPGIVTQAPDNSWIVTWDVDSLAFGDYEVRVFAQYNDMNDYQRSEYTVPVDYTRPDYVKITNVTDAPDAFSPNNDGDFDTTTINYEISKNADVTINIYNGSDILVRILKDNIAEAAGVQNVVWDGKDDSGQILADGIYTYIIDADDGQGNIAQKQGTVALDNHFISISLLAGSDLEGAVTFTAIPSQFVTYLSSVRFYYRLSSEQIWRSIGNAVKQPDDTFMLDWDTTIFENEEVEIREYVCYRDLNNQSRYEYTLPLTYTINNIINIFDVSDAPDSFSPNNDEIRDISTISYEIVNHAGTVTIRIHDNVNNLVRTLKDAVLESFGEQTAAWDGKDDQDALLADGTFTYIIEAEDSAGNVAQAQGEITLDNHPLTVLPVDGSIVAEIVNISAMPSQYCQNISSVYFYVKHEQLNSYQSNLGQAQQQPDGSWTVEWDTNGFIDGIYELRLNLYCRDLDGNLRSEEVYSYYKVANGNLIVGVSDSPDPISPNGDNRYDRTLIGYTLGIEADVSIYILDETSNIIRTLQNNDHLVSGYYSIFWDGKDDDEREVSDGNYTYEIKAVHTEGHEETEQAVISVDTQFASIVEPAADSSLNGTIRFRIQPSPYVASVSNVAVYTGSTRIGFALQLPDDTWELVWDTEILSDGNYKFKMYVTYIDSGDLTRQDSTPEVEYTIANNLQVSRNAFSPNDDGNYDTTTIYYNAALYGEVTVKIYDSSDDLVRIIEENGVIGAGNNNFVWDGKNDAGAVVADGVYTYKLNMNFVNLSTDHQEGTVTVDNNFLYITSPSPGSALSQTAIFNVSSSPFITDAVSLVSYYRKLEANEWIRMVNNVDYQGFGEWMTAWDTFTVSNGDYEICFSARYKDINGFDRNEYTMPKMYQVVNTFTITNPSDSPDAFSPNGDGTFETTTIECFINSSADVSVAVYDSNDNLVRTLEESVTKPAGENSVVWDGKDNFGAIVLDGTYTYRIAAEDTQGGVDDIQDTVCVDNHFMTIDEPLPDQTISGEVTFVIKPSLFVSGASFAILKIMQNQRIFICEKQIDGSFTANIDTKTIANGEYDFQIIGSYYDQNSRARTESSSHYKYTIYNEAPEISDLKAMPNPFSPDGSGTWIDPDTGEVFNDPAPGLILDDITTVSFLASTYGVFNINIFNQNNQLIKTLANNQVLSPDPQTQRIEIIWDGSSTWSLTNGRYNLVLDCGSGTQEQTLEIIVDKLPVISDSSLFPNPFLPDSDENNQTEIIFKLNEKAYVNIEIIKDGEVVRNLAVSEWNTTAGDSYVWGGIDNSGNVVGGGNYIVKISAESEFGTKSEPVELSVFVSSLTDINVSQQSLNPYAGETVIISYRLEEDKILSFRIYNDNDQLVRTLVNDQVRQTGANAEIWDGKDDSGEILPDDVYYFLVEEDLEGTQTLIYDPRGTDGLNISTSVSFTVSNFNPRENKFCLLSYDVPESVYHTIRVRNMWYSGAEIKVIKYEEPIAAGHHASYWDGRDEAGDLVPYSNYVFGLWAYRVNVNSVIIVGGRPELTNMSVTPINFSPYDNPYKSILAGNQIEIGFDLSRDANVSIYIYNESGELVRMLKNDEAYLQGYNTAYWNGLADDGSMLKNGDYRIMIQAHSNDNYSDVQALHVCLVL